MTRCQRNELSALAQEECVKAYQKRARSLLNKRHEGRVEIIFFDGIQDISLKPQSTVRDLCVPSICFGRRVLGVDEYRDRGCLRYQFTQQLYLFCHKVNIEQANPCCVATGPIKAGSQTELDWITAGREEDRNGRGCRLRGECHSGTANRNDHCHATIANQISDDRR